MGADKRPEAKEIEITPEMIAAGERELLTWDHRVMDARDVAELVYEAMFLASPRKPI